MTPDTTRGTIRDWDAAYDNSASVPGSAAFGPKWQAEAAAFRTALGPRAGTGIAYGSGARQQLDLFRPEGEARGLLVYIHGGYWRMRARSDWSHLAAGALARGWAVAIPGYTLCPQATLPDIRDEVLRAVALASARVAGPLVITGHSAGGHLATRLLCADLDLPFAGRIARVLSISGVHDLRPLRRTAMATDLRLDAGTAAAESPALLVPREGVPVTAWVGGAELPEFRRQAALLACVWAGLGVEARLVETPGENHFTVIEPLTDPASPLVAELLGAEPPLVLASPEVDDAAARRIALLKRRKRVRREMPPPRRRRRRVMS